MTVSNIEQYNQNIPEIIFLPVVARVCNPRYSNAHFITTVIYVSISMLSKIVMNCNLLRILLNMWLSKWLNAMMIQSFKNWKIQIVLQLVHDCLHFNVMTGDVTERFVLWERLREFFKVFSVDVLKPVLRFTKLKWFPTC